jgi:RNA polymerase sigma factor (TIGR02999 family)
MAGAERVTELLKAWGRGNSAALEKLVPLVELDLRQLARRHMARERTGHTLQTTALVNEAYVRLVDGAGLRARDRVHFFALAARLMRHILVDHARAKGNQKRGGGLWRVPLDVAEAAWPDHPRDLVALDDALEALSAIDPRRGRVVELRYFGGLTVEETARVLNLSVQTVNRDWQLARVFLRRELHRAEQRAS